MALLCFCLISSVNVVLVYWCIEQMNAPSFDDVDVDDGSVSEPIFEYTCNASTKTMLRGSDGSLTSIPMNKDTMSSFVKNAAVMIKAHVQEQNASASKLSVNDIALYNPDDDEFAQSTLASTFL